MCRFWIGAFSFTNVLSFVLSASAGSSSSDDILVVDSFVSGSDSPGSLPMTFDDRWSRSAGALLMDSDENESDSTVGIVIVTGGAESVLVEAPVDAEADSVVASVIPSSGAWPGSVRGV